ncbi:MAG TPA: hypothetical protein VK888_05690 [Anaerolineales bacterium]|nr:hypothetical protein [Anaerolineales bacterium]
MFLILAGVTGLLAALLIHGVTWYARLNYLPLTVVAGVLSALGLTGFFLLFLNSDIANMMLIVLVIFWAVALALGYLQARLLAIPWWKGVMGVFFEMAVAFLIGAAVNLTLQRYIEWFNEQFPGMDVYAVINSFLWVMIITLLVLAVLRPLFLLNKARTGQ